MRRRGALGLLIALAVLAAPSSASAGRVARQPTPGKKVLVFVGLPGAGKSTAANRAAERLGARRRSTGDVIRSTIRARGLRYNAKNDRAVAEEFARKPGEI